ncbi:MAG: dTDP-4-dehydrorhamnose reductase [Mariniphaga sp.]|nr:dTDP-4-dehydrorhamnose reductase [Mariniphaga sp.]
MNVLVTGAYGQLGSEISALSGLYPELNIIGTDVDSLDITDNKSVEDFFKKIKPGFVINCAAYTAVDKAEDEIEPATLINATAPGIIALACKKYNSKLIQISTDYVFNGKGFRPYNEEDPVDPIGVYGKSKYEGEINCLNNNSETVIIRTSWLYSSYGKNFVKTILKIGKEKDLLKVIFDQVGSPTYAKDLAIVLLKIINQYIKSESNFTPGIYHYSNEGVSSWYDFSVAILKMANISCKISPVKSEEFITLAKRPHYSVLDKTKIKTTYNLEIQNWRESLLDCIQTIIKD